MKFAVDTACLSVGHFLERIQLCYKELLLTVICLSVRLSVVALVVTPTWFIISKSVFAPYNRALQYWSAFQPTWYAVCSRCSTRRHNSSTICDCTTTSLMRW